MRVSSPSSVNRNRVGKGFPLDFVAVSVPRRWMCSKQVVVGGMLPNDDESIIKSCKLQRQSPHFYYSPTRPFECESLMG